MLSSKGRDSGAEASMVTSRPHPNQSRAPGSESWAYTDCRKPGSAGKRGAETTEPPFGETTSRIRTHHAATLDAGDPIGHRGAHQSALRVTTYSIDRPRSWARPRLSRISCKAAVQQARPSACRRPTPARAANDQPRIERTASSSSERRCAPLRTTALISRRRGRTIARATREWPALTSGGRALRHGRDHEVAVTASLVAVRSSRELKATKCLPGTPEPGPQRAPSVPARPVERSSPVSPPRLTLLGTLDHLATKPLASALIPVSVVSANWDQDAGRVPVQKRLR